MAKQFLESLTRICLVAGSLMAFSGAAEAASIEFEDADINGGILSYDGNGSPLIGENLLLDSVRGSNTPLNSGVILSCVECKLNLKTGSYIPDTFYDFDWEGSSLTITGTVKNGGTTIAAGTLVSGSFTENVTVSASVSFLGGEGLNTIHPDLSYFFGIKTTDFTFIQTSIVDHDDDTDKPNGGFIGIVTNVDIDNTPIDPEENTPVSVPEPGTLLGLGLVSAGLIVSRRRSIIKK